MCSIERAVMDAKQLKAIENIKCAVDVNDSDTLSMLSGDSQVLWTASGSWTGSRNVTLGDLRAIAAIAPPVAAWSVDTAEFQRLAELWRYAPAGTREFMAAWDGQVAHIDAWGAQQREAVLAEQLAVFKKAGDSDQAEFNRKWTEQKARAEKAEADARKLSLDLLAAHGETDAALDRVKQLEAEREAS